jgi:DNA (cytosine-5)-methyltransferase 1
MASYYNEFDPFAAAWLRELIKAGEIANGEVDERSIEDVRAADLAGFQQCHFFAGIGGWSLALRLAGWPEDRPVWTGSCPCQRFSSATRGRTVAADMWPEFRRLIGDALPRVVFGEQVAHARGWFDGVCDDVEALGYTVGAAILPAASVGQDHARSRIYFACHANGHSEPVVPVNAEVARLPRHRSNPGVVVPANGLSRDMVALSGFGNAIVPQVAAEVIRAYLECAA